MSNLARDGSGARRILTRNLVLLPPRKHCFQKSLATFCQETPGSTRFGRAHMTLLGLPWPLALFQGAEFHHFGTPPHTLMVKDMNSRAEGLWRESRGVLFFKGAYTLATHEGSWCYLCFVVLAEWLGADENIAVGSKWSSPSQHRVSLASMTSQSQKSHLQPVCLAAVCLAAVCLGILN